MSAADRACADPLAFVVVTVTLAVCLAFGGITFTACFMWMCTGQRPW